MECFIKNKMTTIDGVDIESYGANFSGVAYKSARTKQLSVAVKTPEVHLDSRAEALDGLAAVLNAAFQNKYAEWISIDLPSREAKVRAEAFVSALATAGLADIELVYPSNVADTALNVTYRASDAGKAGFQINARGSHPASIETGADQVIKARRARSSKK